MGNNNDVQLLRNELARQLAIVKVFRETLESVAEPDALVQANPGVFGLHAYTRCQRSAEIVLANFSRPTCYPGVTTSTLD